MNELTNAEYAAITKKLDTTVSAGAKKHESNYALLGGQQFPLKAKYRLGGNEFSKGSNNANGRSGVAKHKVAQKDQKPPKPMTLVVDGRTGKSRFVEIGD